MDMAKYRAGSTHREQSERRIREFAYEVSALPRVLWRR